MRVIIAGGTGMIGRALAAGLAQDDHEVVVLTRHPGAASLQAGVRAVLWDGATPAGWGHLADGAEAVVNLAGEPISAGRWSRARKARIVSSRVNAGHAVAAAIKDAARPPAVLVQSSAVGYYGFRGDALLTEAEPAGQDYLGQACVQWEASSLAVEMLGVRRVILRTGVVLSCDGGALPRLVLPFRLFAGGPIGGGKQWLSWIHIADEVRAIRFLIEHSEAQGAFNLAAPNPVTYATIARLLGHVLHRPALLPVPAIALRLVFGEMATILLESQRVVPTALTRLGFAFNFSTVEPALRDLLPQ